MCPSTSLPGEALLHVSGPEALAFLQGQTDSAAGGLSDAEVDQMARAPEPERQPVGGEELGIPGRIHDALRYGVVATLELEVVLEVEEAIRAHRDREVDRSLPVVASVRHDDVQRCLICVPGNLADQWQDELWLASKEPTG